MKCFKNSNESYRTGEETQVGKRIKRKQDYNPVGYCKKVVFDSQWEKCQEGLAQGVTLFELTLYMRFLVTQLRVDHRELGPKLGEHFFQ
jgi:hypothetical protein